MKLSGDDNEALTIAELVALLQAQPDQHRRVYCTAEGSKPKRERKTREQSEPEPADPLHGVREQLCRLVRGADAATLELIAAFFGAGIEKKN